MRARTLRRQLATALSRTALRSPWPISVIAISGLLGWLQPMPSIPADHDGLCRQVSFAGASFIVCSVDLSTHDLQLMALDGADRPFETFQAVEAALAERGRDLALAVNAGMYHEDRRPVGLAIQDGRTLHETVRGTGSGNFSLQPNGIFFVEDGRAAVHETGRYIAGAHRPDLATQSGPMLLVDGQIHPRFIEGSDSRFVRNGVCATDEGRSVHLVLSRAPINFHDFAVFFRDAIGCRNALFFDGQVSSLYAPELGIDFRRDRLGPILAVTPR